jgi:hypothetical protein
VPDCVRVADHVGGCSDMGVSMSQDTVDHVKKVRDNLFVIRNKLAYRANVHDASKMQEPELSGYAEMTETFKGKHYGTPEYMATIALFKPIVDHHYRHNSHHPEHWPNGVADMSLLDIIEMLADWKAANDRRGGDFAKSIQVSIERFKISEQLGAILLNTAKELGYL